MEIGSLQHYDVIILYARLADILLKRLVLKARSFVVAVVLLVSIVCCCCLCVCQSRFFDTNH